MSALLPQYQQQVEPALTPITTVQPDPSAGQGLEFAGKAIKGVVDPLESIASDLYKKQIVTSVADAQTTAQGESDLAVNQAMAVKGTAAEAAVTTAKQAVLDAHAKAAQNLDGPALDLFNEESKKALLNYNNMLDRHRFQQLEVGFESKAASYAAKTVHGASLKYNDPAAIEADVAQSGDYVYALGASPEDSQAKVAALKQDTWTEAIHGALAANDFAQAKILLDDHRADLGEKGPQLEHAVRTAGLGVLATTGARSIVDSARYGPNNWVDPAKAVAALKGITDPQLYEETRQRVREMLSDEGTAQATTKDQAYSAAFSAYLQGGSGAIPAVAKSWLIANAPDDWEKIKLRMREDANYSLEHQRANPDQTRAMTAFEFMAATRPEVFADPAFTADRFDRVVGPQLAPADYKRARDMVFEIKKGASGGTGGSGGAAIAPIDKEILLATARKAMGTSGDPATWSPEETAAWAWVSQDVADKRVQFRRANGKEPDLPTVQSWINDGFISGSWRGTGFLFDKKATRAEAVMSGFNLNQFEPKWTSEQKDAARAELRRQGATNITPDLINATLRAQHELPFVLTPAPASDVSPPAPAGWRTQNELQEAIRPSVPTPRIQPVYTVAPPSFVQLPQPAEAAKPVSTAGDQAIVAENARQGAVVTNALKDAPFNEQVKARLEQVFSGKTPEEIAAGVRADVAAGQKASAGRTAWTRKEREAQLQAQGLAEDAIRVQLKREGY